MRKEFSRSSEDRHVSSRAYILLIIVLLFAFSALAQEDRDAFEKQRQTMRERYNQQRNRMGQQYDDARRKAEEEYAAFRKRANEAYASAIERAWNKMHMEPAKPKPKEPEPPKPMPAPRHDEGWKPQTASVPLGVVETPEPVEPELPAPPIPEPAPTTPMARFTVYGSECTMHAEVNALSFKLSSVDEKGAAKAWKLLSEQNFDGVLHDCLKLRDQMQLGDWGYMRLLQEAADKIVGKGTNESVLLQMYLLCQSGYKVRMAKADNAFVLLVPFNRTIYGYSYVDIDGTHYYVLSKRKANDIYVSNVGFPREQVANVKLERLPLIGGKSQAPRTFTAERFGTMQAQVAVDKQLIDFMNDYPLTDAWDYYAKAGLSDGVKATLYPALRSQLDGKSKKKQVTMLLDFVQTAFVYATDQMQFGYERPLFGDESFFYPKNDCEDRSILFSILVRDLVGLDVVLVNWPGHLATAVAFPDEVEGSYFTVDGRRFTVCDPTYIGAGVGEAMPQFSNVEGKIVKL